MSYNAILGDLSEAVRPDPIPNSVVKRFSGDDNISARVCENTSLPGFLFIYLFIIVTSLVVVLLAVTVTEILWLT